MLSYTYQQNVYMIYSSLKNKTNEEFMKVNWYGAIVTGLFYILFAITSVFMFGKNLDMMILNNIGAARTPDGGAFWEALILQIAFAAMLLCHTPFVFCSGKEALLIVIDEVMRRSISNALWHKLQNNEYFREQTKGKIPPNPVLAIPGETEPYFKVLRKSQDIETNSRKQ